jgi:hypothetical protein
MCQLELRKENFGENVYKSSKIIGRNVYEALEIIGRNV